MAEKFERTGASSMWKRRFKFIILLCFVKIFRIMIYFFKPEKIPGSAMLLPPAGPGSIGDQAMLAAGIQHLRQMGVGYIGLTSFSNGSSWKDIGPIDETVKIDGFFRGDRFIPYCKGLVAFISRVRRYEKLYCLGTDIMDGFFSNSVVFKRVMLLFLSDSLKTKTSLINFSFNNQPTQESVRYLRSLPQTVHFRVRDEESLRRFKISTGRQAKRTADISFLLRPEPACGDLAATVHWLSEQKEKNKKVIGVNPSIFLIQSCKASVSECVDIYAHLIERIYSVDTCYSFMLMGHDSRGDMNGFEIAKKIKARLDADATAIDSYETPCCSAQQMRTLIKDLEIILCGRMHLAIAGLTQGVPVACIGYQDKFAGMLGDFGLSDAVVGANPLFMMDKYYQIVKDVLANRQKLNCQINANLSRVKELACENFN